MDEKTLVTLEFHKILDQIAERCSFSASAEKAHALRPTDYIVEAQLRSTITSEAVALLSSSPDMSIGGARDVREALALAQRGGVLDPVDLLDIKYTLIAARNICRTFERLGDSFPNLVDLAFQLPSVPGVVDKITRSLSERGEILDSASDKLANIRRDMHIVHDRLLTKLQRMVTDTKYTAYLQEPIVTQRDGRYVLPLRAEFKGRIRSIVHDQSASGATLFVEPLSVVDQNNQYRELLLEERDEERRILVQLSGLVGDHTFEIGHAVDIMAELDFAFARARFAFALDASAPNLIPVNRNSVARQKPLSKISDGSEKKPMQEKPSSGSVIRLFQARHPLLDPKGVVPIDVEMDQDTFALVITGPNTGGKTVTLKTVGLLILMAQSGLHIPAQAGSEISVFKNIFADIGDEQSIEQSLSTFSSHINNIIRILEQADGECLVILDELGAGTDPQEGAALARAILGHLVSHGITTLVTTHHPELKTYAHATAGVTNASVLFDLESLRPTYHLTIGLPGRSNALAIAERLGLPGEIINLARSEIDPNELRVDDLLDEIHHQREMARNSRVKADDIRLEVERLRQELYESLSQIEEERRLILDEARMEASTLIDQLRVKIIELENELKQAHQPIDAINLIEDQADKLERTYEKPIERQEQEFSTKYDNLVVPSKRSLQLGDKVYLHTLNTKGIVTALMENEAEVQVGMLRVRARLGELTLPSSVDESGSSTKDVSQLKRNDLGDSIQVSSPAVVSPGIELDLRGMRADDALEALDRYLDAAYIAQLPWVRIIHGKGTGKLRAVVRQALGNHAHIKSFESGGNTEGGEGVTIAKLADK